MNYTAFLENRETDDRGRMFDSVMCWSNFRLEITHDYIQAVFPTDESSKYTRLNEAAPKDISSLRQSEKAKDNIRKAYLKMLCLWKLDGEKYKNIKIHRYWNHANNHNHLRMTRVLKCFRLLQMNDELKDFSSRLTYLLERNGLKISKETERFWKANFYVKTQE